MSSRKHEIKNLILNVKKDYDTARIKLKEWDCFLDALCGDREYQKEAIQSSIIYLFSEQYKTIECLVKKNYDDSNKVDMHDKYKNINDYLESLPLPKKLSGVIDLATGTGKSYVIYGIAQIAMEMGFVDKVIVLCPSLTIESSLTEKFGELSSNNDIIDSMPNGCKTPRIINANSTVVKGDICVENIHAVYEKTGSSIEDSIAESPERIMVLNDEVHHVYNGNDKKISGKWISFLKENNFKYIMGFTGTAFIKNEYFNDVIYRYSLREAMDDGVVKSVSYVKKDEFVSNNAIDKHDEKFQKIYDNHTEFVKKYSKVKPITILVTAKINGAKQLAEDLSSFLQKQRGMQKDVVDKTILVVTSDKVHKDNIAKLKKVDDKDSPVEWIVSVSMLTEGWDVKNVFQIVPWEDRAFNSKLLIAQVLGRGLRVPKEYSVAPLPKVRVFNHNAWSDNIISLVDEVLEREQVVTSNPIGDGVRHQHHFGVYQMNYNKTEIISDKKQKTKEFNYSKTTINLVSQSLSENIETEYEDINKVTEVKTTVIKKRTHTVDQVVSKITEAFKTREFEAKIRFPGNKVYGKNNLPPSNEIKSMIIKSMEDRGIDINGPLTEDNANRIYSSFQTLFRESTKSIKIVRESETPFLINTNEMKDESMSVGVIRRGDGKVFHTSGFKEESSPDTADALQKIIEDEKYPRSANKEVNHHSFKTPVNIVLAKSSPERLFIELLIKDEVSESLNSWIKSRDVGFYSIKYSLNKGTHTINGEFNPDFFLKIGDNIVVVEIKSDDDDSDKNKAKYKNGKQHFIDLNDELAIMGEKQRYFFHFLSPSSYSTFKNFLIDRSLLNGTFKSKIESLLDNE